MKNHDQDMHYGAEPSTYKNAQILRNNETQTEKVLWNRLRNKALGVKFRRQHPIGDYIVDFYCHKLKLVIELDGKYHEKPNQIRMDEFKEEALKESGIKIIRFPDESVVNDIDSVVEKIKNNIANADPL